MPPISSSKGLTITNPLVLYRSLLAAKRIDNDPAQHRLAIHLQKLYERLKDYEPAVQYRHRLDEVGRFVREGSLPQAVGGRSEMGNRLSWSSFLGMKQKRESLSLIRVVTSHEAAMELDSPKGLLLHGEVGTGKSMLIDLFAECLPTRKKRRWHFNTFMLETLAKLEDMRRAETTVARLQGDISPHEHSILRLARDMITTSPILFLDEFQLPDRVTSRIISGLMTSFFRLGGVLIATSNRMPEELAKAAGIEFSGPPPRSESSGQNSGINTTLPGSIGKSFAGQGDFIDFLELLTARCEIWEIEGTKDYRQRLVPSNTESSAEKSKVIEKFASPLHQAAPLEEGRQIEQPDRSNGESKTSGATLPENYFVQRSGKETPELLAAWLRKLRSAESAATGMTTSSEVIPWQPTSLRVYGRKVNVPRHFSGVSCWSFDELCATQMGPADYISLASTFHTIILHDVPVLTLSQKNEARRFITLLDALYEAGCKLLVTAVTVPDGIFFPESRAGAGGYSDVDGSLSREEDAIHSETYSEAYQDATEPFRPNISSYGIQPSFIDSIPNRTRNMLAEDALEDDPPNRARQAGVDSGEKTLPLWQPDFSQTDAFTGEDERFAYKRALSRLWQMCDAPWWDRVDEGWWKPLPKELRRWERSRDDEFSEKHRDSEESIGNLQGPEEDLFRHGASPFRIASEPPPKISWTHIWGTVKWGKRAGPWGKGPEGLSERKKQ